MKTDPRLRPRTWMSRRRDPVILDSPLRWWRPLSLIFRHQRSHVRLPEPQTLPGASHSQPTLTTHLERHAHYHTHLSARLFVQDGRGDRIRLSRTPENDWRRFHDARIPHRIADVVVRIRPERRIINAERLFNISQLLRSRTTEQNVTRLAHHVETRQLTRGFHPMPRPLSGISVRQFRDAVPIVQRTKHRLDTIESFSSTAPTTTSQMSRAPLEHRARRRTRDPGEPSAERLRERFVEQHRVPIVWRQGLADRNEANGAGRAQGAEFRVASAPAVHEPSALPRASVSSMSPVTVAKLDGPAIDRLADDVMQRIDRRIRIERERRGI